jgi:hypothetical protein
MKEILYFKQISFDDAGTYSCDVNIDGETKSAEIEILVNKPS